MLSAICAEIRNYFTYPEDKHPGTYKVVGGSLVPAVDFLTDYYAIFGSRKNDGVHKTTDELKDEGEFKGNVWIMSIPADFLAVAEEIKAWQDKYGGIDSEAQSPFNSESFAGYAYSKSSGNANTDGRGTTWQGVYSARLDRWRRVRLH